MNSAQQTVRDIMLPLSGFPCLKESATVQEAIQQLRSFCPIGGSSPCGFSVLMVVDGRGNLIGRVTQQGILRILFTTLLDPIDIKPFSGKIPPYADLTTLLNSVLIREGVNHLNAPLSAVIEKGIQTLPASSDLIHAMAVMVIRQETVLPVEDGGKLAGVVQLSEVFGAIGDQLIAMNSK